MSISRPRGIKSTEFDVAYFEVNAAKYVNWTDKTSHDMCS